jgi:putrescine:ornithine antiporter
MFPVLGNHMSVQYSGGTPINRTFTPTTRLAWVQNVTQALSDAGWTTISGTPGTSADVLMESAAQNSAAVENPKRNVPLACMFGTLGAAVIYVLSTTVIQGIVPNAELAKSTGPFGLAYAQMFSPTVGSIVMGLAAMACVGSLLGWQFTLAEIARASAEERMFPTLFGKVNRMGAPVIGMLVLGVVQSVMALSTISPNLSQQFSALVNLAVVTNVLPYIIALSALKVMMEAAKVERSVYLRNMVIALVAMLYSTYAIWASGLQAVMGGVLVMSVGYIIWGFIAPRFTSGTTAARAPTGVAGVAVAAFAIAFLAALPSPSVEAATGTVGTLDRVKQSGKLTLGYRTDAPPFSYRDESGSAAGYSVALCQKIAEQVKADLKLPSLAVEWLAVTTEGRFQALLHVLGKRGILARAADVYAGADARGEPVRAVWVICGEAPGMVGGGRDDALRVGTCGEE